jgi:hypothetical protein
MVRSIEECEMAKKIPLAAQLAAMEARALGAEQALAALTLRLKQDYVERAEYNRVQALLRVMQTKLVAARGAVHEMLGAGAPSDRPVSERRLAMQRAKLEAMSTGKSVAVVL